jgi:hypothetical protein
MTSQIRQGDELTQRQDKGQAFAAHGPIAACTPRRPRRRGTHLSSQRVEPYSPQLGLSLASGPHAAAPSLGHPVHARRGRPGLDGHVDPRRGHAGGCLCVCCLGWKKECLRRNTEELTAPTHSMPLNLCSASVVLCLSGHLYIPRFRYRVFADTGWLVVCVQTYCKHQMNNDTVKTLGRAMNSAGCGR